LQAVHAQLQSIALLPVALILAVSMVRAEADGRTLRARSLAIALSSLMAAWFLTSYYMAWFTIFSACLYAISWMALSGTWKPGNVVRFANTHLVTIALGSGSFLILITPFLMVYLPKMHETGGEDYHEMLGYLVTPIIDMVNVGPQNYLWGWIFRPLLALAHVLLPDDAALPGRVLRGEHEAGFPLLMFLLIVVSVWRVIVDRQLADGSPASVQLRSFALAIAVAWLLTLQFWVASPWGLVFEFVPGAKGMRVVSRYQLWLTLPFLILVLAVWRTRLARLIQSAPLIAAGLVLLLIVENLSGETAAQLRRSEQLAALWNIPKPPQECSAFYVTASRQGEALYMNQYMNDRYPHNVDAMLLAELWRKPTINGFSTFNPPDWNFTKPQSVDYDARVKAYATRHSLHRLCRLDVRQDKPWTVFD
jgi:hypothetical protein